MYAASEQCVGVGAFPERLRDRTVSHVGDGHELDVFRRSEVAAIVPGHDVIDTTDQVHDGWQLARNGPGRLPSGTDPLHTEIGDERGATLEAAYERACARQATNLLAHIDGEILRPLHLVGRGSD